jgi:hypothetical protein
MFSPATGSRKTQSSSRPYSSPPTMMSCAACRDLITLTSRAHSLEQRLRVTPLASHFGRVRNHQAFEANDVRARVEDAVALGLKRRGPLGNGGTGKRAAFLDGRKGGRLTGQCARRNRPNRCRGRCAQPDQQKTHDHRGPMVCRQLPKSMPEHPQHLSPTALQLVVDTNDRRGPSVGIQNQAHV